MKFPRSGNSNRRIEGVGRAVSIRRIEAADLPALRNFVSHLSRETGYKRLLSGRTPTEEELQRWCSIDPLREEAIVAITRTGNEDTLAGVARYVQESADAADFAIVLADAWQGLGLGKLLMSALVASAKERGLHRLTGITLSSNLGMLSLARGLGFTTTRLPDAFTTRLSLQLVPTHHFQKPREHDVPTHRL